MLVNTNSQNIDSCAQKCGTDITLFNAVSWVETENLGKSKTEWSRRESVCYTQDLVMAKWDTSGAMGLLLV